MEAKCAKKGTKRVAESTNDAEVHGAARVVVFGGDMLALVVGG